MINSPFSKKLGIDAPIINELQIKIDDIDDETKKMIDQKSVNQFNVEISSITQEIDKLYQELLEINEKSNELELLLNSQQQCILLLNKDNDELEKILNKTQKSKREKNKKAKNIKESELFQQIRSSIDKQEEIVNKTKSIIQKDTNMQKITAIRKRNLISSSEKLSDFNLIIYKRNNLIERYKECSDEMNNHTKRNKLLKEYEDLLSENKKLVEIYSEKNKQKDIYEKKKAKLTEIENKINEMESIKEKTKKIETEIENMKSYPEISQILDAQVTQSQYLESQFYSSIGCVTEGPQFNNISEKDIKKKTYQIEKEINDFEQQKSFESNEIIKMLEIQRDQHKDIYEKINLLINHLRVISS